MGKTRRQWVTRPTPKKKNNETLSLPPPLPYFFPFSALLVLRWRCKGRRMAIQAIERRRRDRAKAMSNLLDDHVPVTKRKPESVRQVNPSLRKEKRNPRLTMQATVFSK
jgi:hypothetical protein